MTTREITLETMKSEHLDGAVALSRQAGWPHRREDWELVWSISEGIVALEDDRVVATTLVTSYGEDAATINMVIVDAAMRGRGLGRKLMEAALARAGERACLLVATQEGLPLYEKLGFVATGHIAQYQGEALPVGLPDSVSWAETRDHDSLPVLDREATGHDRSALMRLLRQRAKFAVIRDNGEMQGFAAVRAFGRGLVIGPVVARNDTEAKALIDFLLAQHKGSFVRLDTDVSTNLAEWLAGRGLAHAGGGVAMRRAPVAQQESRIAHYRRYALVSQALG